MQIKCDFMRNHSSFVPASMQQHDSRAGMQIHVAVTLLKCCQQTNLTHLENKGRRKELLFRLFILQRCGKSERGKRGKREDRHKIDIFRSTHKISVKQNASKTSKTYFPFSQKHDNYMRSNKRFCVHFVGNYALWI